MKLGKFAAYHGKGWRARTARSDEELARRGAPWSSLRVDSEYRPLKAVLLHLPGGELDAVRRPNAIQHLARVDAKTVATELNGLASLYRRLGLAVHFIDANALANGVAQPNLMYTRDLFFNTRAGSVLARMGSRVRAGEEKHAARALVSLAIPIARTIGGHGTFEGADALWLDRLTVACGIGARTNVEGLRQLREELQLQDVRCVPVKLPRGVQHLLGILQIVDRDLALLRAELAPPPLLALLKRHRIRVIDVPECDEVSPGQGMNIVTVRPRTIVMPSGCPRLARLYRAAGLTIAGQIGIGELAKGAGGIACATGILAREVARP